jgi:hypothetical protein
MKGACPCGRRCTACPYEEMCGGCLGDSCIHVRQESSQHSSKESRCFFGKLNGLYATCPVLSRPPPREFELASPETLAISIWNLNTNRDEMTNQPIAPEWPLLIPEISDITQTTSRLGVWPDEGDWQIPSYDPIAWDMTGYLFDKIQGAPWVREPESFKVEDWFEALGPREGSIKRILFIDRLPDYMAMNIAPSSIMVAYLNRLWAYQYLVIDHETAAVPWLLTHGYPSYIDWPPAWHWNLGIRMLSSLSEYLVAQGHGYAGPGESAWMPDKSQLVTEEVRLPFVRTASGDRLLKTPDEDVDGLNDMEWNTFPGIIPFIPGADTNQLSYFTKQAVKMGFKTVAIDAVNSIAHENFKGLPDAVSAVLRNGAEHVMVYGPWPLHPPSKHVPT